jgi:hypothetical protein
MLAPIEMFIAEDCGRIMVMKEVSRNMWRGSLWGN